MLIETCKYLEINTTIKVFSEMNCNLEAIKQPGDWAFQISKSLKVDTYINPIDGSSLFDKEKFNNEDINLKFIESKLLNYNQKRDTFEPGLSIVDVLMYCDKEEIKHMLAQGKIIV